jgi:hypothetical protein
MASDYIGQQIRRCNRNLIIIGLCVLVIPALVLGFSHRMLYNFFKGPFPIDTETLRKIDNPGDRSQYYVSYRAEIEPIDTGMREGTKDVMNKKFLMLYMDEEGHRFLFATVPIKHEGQEFVGRLTRISGASDTDKLDQVKKNATKNNPNLQIEFLPYQLDCYYNFRGQTWAMLGCMIPLIIGGLWPIGLALKRIINPASHPIQRKLHALGDSDTLRAEIDREVMEGPTIRIGRLLVTRAWLLSHGLIGLDLAHLEDVVWAHKLVIRGQGASIQAVICTRHKTTFNVRGRDKDVDEMLKLILAQVPWALIGYDAMLAQAWQTTPDMVIQAVADRRQKYEANPQAFLAPPDNPEGPAS